MTEGRVPEPVPEPDHPYLAPDGWDPRPEMGTPANHPVSGSPLRSVLCTQPPTA